MKADTNLLVTVSARNNGGRWQVFATNLSERFVFGVRNFADFDDAKLHAEALADRLSSRLLLRSTREMELPEGPALSSIKSSEL